MDCKRDKNNYCPKKQCFVDDRGCAKCDGDPKPVKITPPKPPTELQIFYNTCKGICETCGECLIAEKLCKAGRYDKGYFCKLARWPEPPEILKPAMEILTQ